MSTSKSGIGPYRYTFWFKPWVKSTLVPYSVWLFTVFCKVWQLRCISRKLIKALFSKNNAFMVTFNSLYSVCSVSYLIIGWGVWSIITYSKEMSLRTLKRKHSFGFCFGTPRSCQLLPVFWSPRVVSRHLLPSVHCSQNSIQNTIRSVKMSQICALCLEEVWDKIWYFDNHHVAHYECVQVWLIQKRWWV